MPLYWLCYRHNNHISVVIEPGASLVHARMRAELADLDQGEFTEAHELDHKWRERSHPRGRLRRGRSSLVGFLLVGAPSMRLWAAP